MSDIATPKLSTLSMFADDLDDKATVPDSLTARYLTAAPPRLPAPAGRRAATSAAPKGSEYGQDLDWATVRPSRCRSRSPLSLPLPPPRQPRRRPGLQRPISPQPASQLQPSQHQLAAPGAAAATPSAGQASPAQTGSSTTGTQAGVETAQPAGAQTAAPDTSIQMTASPIDDADAFPVRTVFGASALLAAGVISVIGVRRQLQERRRVFGDDIALPTDDDAVVEQQFRSTADQLAWEDIDQALRQLARDCAAQHLPMPTIRAARLTEAQLELYLTAPAKLPAPWRALSDDTVWFFGAETVSPLDGEDLENIPAPYPALVTLGQDSEGGHVLVDLEYFGALALDGTPQASRDVMAALAIELANSRWADDLTVTVVGGSPSWRTPSGPGGSGTCPASRSCSTPWSAARPPTRSPWTLPGWGRCHKRVRRASSRTPGPRDRDVGLRADRPATQPGDEPHRGDAAARVRHHHRPVPHRVAADNPLRRRSPPAAHGRHHHSAATPTRGCCPSSRPRRKSKAHAGNDSPWCLRPPTMNLVQKASSGRGLRDRPSPGGREPAPVRSPWR